MDTAYKEIGRTIRFVVTSNERTVRLAVLTIIFLIAWNLFY